MEKEINHLTVKEVIEFNPSMENPMEVDCFTGYYSVWGRIRIVAIHDHRYAFIGKDDLLNTNSISELRHYASLKQPKDKIALYRTIESLGNYMLCNSDGEYPNFERKYFEGNSKFDGIRKANRQKDPCAFLDPDTFEIEWVN